MIRRILGWLKDSARFLWAQPARLAVVLLFGAAGALAGVPVGDAGLNYMWRDARFCDDCHVHDYANEAWARSVHADLTTCHDCHLVPIRHYPRNLWVTVFATPQGPEDIHRPEVETVICERCHSVHTDEEELTGPMAQPVRKQVVKIDESPLHRVHLDAKSRTPARYLGGDGIHGDAKGEHGGSEGGHAPAEGAPAEGGGHGGAANTGPISCMDCHGAEENRAHRFQAGNENCLSCHEGQDLVGVGRLEQLACRECHFQGFLGATKVATAGGGREGDGHGTDEGKPAEAH